MAIKNRLKEIRMKEYMMNQKEFAEFLGIDYRQYNRYENGVVPSLEVVLKICKKLNKNIEQVFYLAD